MAGRLSRESEGRESEEECVRKCACVRRGERVKEIEWERETENERERQRDREKERQNEGQNERQRMRE
jgi:hypothetical protein